MGQYYTHGAGFESNAVSLSKGNPGAATVLAEAGNHLQENHPDQVNEFLSFLDEMNLYGQRIWLAYKDYSGEDIEAFVENVFDNDPQMIELVNEMRTDGVIDAVQR